MERNAMTGRSQRRSETTVARGARKEAERRQQVSAGKRYTADDLPADSGSAAPTVPAAAQQEKPALPMAGDASKTPAQEGDAAPPVERRDESYWRARAKEIRAKMQQVRDRVKSLQSTVDDLGAQLERASDSSTASERDVSLRALTNAKKDAESMQGEWARFEARARLMKIEPAWID